MLVSMIRSYAGHSLAITMQIVRIAYDGAFFEPVLGEYALAVGKKFVGSFWVWLLLDLRQSPQIWRLTFANVGLRSLFCSLATCSNDARSYLGMDAWTLDRPKLRTGYASTRLGLHSLTRLLARITLSKLLGPSSASTLSTAPTLRAVALPT